MSSTAMSKPSIPRWGRLQRTSTIFYKTQRDSHFFHDPSIPEEPTIFNWGPAVTWEPTPQDDVAANLDQLNAMLEAEVIGEPVEKSTVEIEVVPTEPFQKPTQVYQHRCGLCNFHHISSVALAAHQKALHPARCCFFCGKVIYR
jgi:hypothetical protein